PSGMDLQAGSRPLGPEGTRFRVWAPKPRSLELVLGAGRVVPLPRDERGLTDVVVPGVGPGARYPLRIDGRLRPDPAGALLPEGVHGPAEVVDLAFPWTDAAYRPRPLRDWTLYELHVGTFSATGDFAGVERALPALRALGIRAVELMPVAPF